MQAQKPFDSLVKLRINLENGRKICYTYYITDCRDNDNYLGNLQIRVKLMKCDLHLHSNCSDGILSPAQIVRRAKEKHLDCIALTDHDTVSGVVDAVAEGDRSGVKVIIGIEISTVSDGMEVHILGYGMDISADGFAAEICRLADLRNRRNVLLAEKLRQHGMEIDLSSLEKEGKSVGRPDIAREMVKKGYCQSVADAFELYIGNGKPCYADVKRLTPAEAISLINRFNGVAVLAHPKYLRMSASEFENFLRLLVKIGLKGIEAEYFTHTNAERKFYGKMAKKYKLAITGGSDYHDSMHGVDIGSKDFSLTKFAERVLKV
ncbi:MAG: PHP domain-containing protein [Corallococcus sp.]|nr:PHP domain-containing protein [Corallococcus sp.]